MKIIVICGAGYISGKEKIILSLLKGFASLGDEVYCITSSWGNGQFEEKLISGKINYAKIRLGFISKTLNWKAFKMTFNQFIYLPQLLYTYNKIIRRFKPDVVIHTNFHHVFLLYAVLKRKGIINVYHSHESIYNTNFYKLLFKQFQKKIDFFIGVSKFVTNKLIDLGISKDKALTIHNGVEIIDQQPKKAGYKDIFNIGIVGQIGSWKGHEDLICALEIINQSFPKLQIKVSIFGKGEPEFVASLRLLIEQKKLDNYIEWKGFVNNVRNIYTQLDVVCIPTRTEEPFATSALEAGLFSVPVIVSKKGGFPEIVRDEYNGFLVAANSPTEIADSILKLINNRVLCNQIGLNHHQLVTRSFSYDSFITNWKKILSDLIV